MASVRVESLDGKRPCKPADSSDIHYPAFTAATRYPVWKRRADRLLAAVLLVPGLPIIGLLVLLVRLTSGAPGIFRQPRVGRDGKVFTLYKIRTMVRNAEAATGPVWATLNDCRVTRIGKILRKLHLDELPQLFNVLKGEMSLVGPRPERPEFIPLLSKNIPNYLQRLEVPPGVTGLAQLNLPPDTDLDSVRRKLALDLEYARRMGPMFDTRVLLCTFGRLFKLPVIRLFGLYRNGELLASGPDGRGAAGGPALLGEGQHREDGHGLHAPAGTSAEPSGDGDGLPSPAAETTRPKPRPK
ncbi:MAG: sugar transferase [Thermoguttaceae bacterium]